MSTVLELVDVASNAILDTVTLSTSGNQVTYRTGAARPVVARLIGQRGERRPDRTRVVQTFAEVAQGGWSNGYTALREAKS